MTPSLRAMGALLPRSDRPTGRGWESIASAAGTANGSSGQGGNLRSDLKKWAISAPRVTTIQEGPAFPSAEQERGMDWTIREMTPADLHHGFLEALASLAEVGLQPWEDEEVFRRRRGG